MEPATSIIRKRRRLYAKKRQWIRGMDGAPLTVVLHECSLCSVLGTRTRAVYPNVVRLGYRGN